jgi:hypothetical protein
MKDNADTVYAMIELLTLSKGSGSLFNTIRHEYTNCKYFITGNSMVIITINDDVETGNVVSLDLIKSFRIHKKK